MKCIKIFMACMLCLFMACTKDKGGDPCEGYEFEFDYEYVNQDNSTNSNLLFGKDVYSIANDDECAEVYVDVATGKRWLSEDVEPGETVRKRIKLKLPGRKLVVAFPGEDEVTVWPDDLLRVVETDYNEWEIIVISNGGSGGNGNGSGGNNNNNNGGSGGNNGGNKTTAVQFKLGEDYAGINVQCLLPVTIEVVEGIISSKVCQYGDNCFPCGSGFKNMFVNPGKSHGRKTINLNKSGEVACGAGGVAVFDLEPGQYTYTAESQACVYYPYENQHSKGFRFGGVFSVTDRDLDKDCKTITISVGPYHATNDAPEINWIKNNCK